MNKMQKAKWTSPGAKKQQHYFGLTIFFLAETFFSLLTKYEWEFIRNLISWLLMPDRV